MFQYLVENPCSAFMAHLIRISHNSIICQCISIRMFCRVLFFVYHGLFLLIIIKIVLYSSFDSMLFCLSFVFTWISNPSTPMYVCLFIILKFLSSFSTNKKHPNHSWSNSGRVLLVLFFPNMGEEKGTYIDDFGC